MSIADAMIPVEAYHKAQVMAATWGHMEAQPGTHHPGWFIFTFTQHGDMVVIESDFPSFGEGPGYFNDRQEFIYSQVKNQGPCSEVGVYRFDGEYCRYARTSKGKEGVLGFFKGKTRRLPIKAWRFS